MLSACRKIFDDGSVQASRVLISLEMLIPEASVWQQELGFSRFILAPAGVRSPVRLLAPSLHPPEG